MPGTTPQRILPKPNTKRKKQVRFELKASPRKEPEARPLQKAKLPKKKSLLDLPPELWEQVVLFTITSNEPIKIFHRLDKKYNAKEVSQPGILNTCTTIRKGYVDRFYRRNLFIAYQYGDGLQDEMIEWLMAIGPRNRLHLNLALRRGSNKRFFPELRRQLEPGYDTQTTVNRQWMCLGGEWMDYVKFGWQVRSDAEEGLPALGRRQMFLPLTEHEAAESEEVGLSPGQEYLARRMQVCWGFPEQHPRGK